MDEALAFFRERAQSVDAHHEGTLAAEIYVELLSRTGHIEGAIDATLQMLPPGTHTRGVAPPLLELSRQAGDYTKVAELCRQRDDLLGICHGRLVRSLDGGRHQERMTRLAPARLRSIRLARNSLVIVVAALLADRLLIQGLLLPVRIHGGSMAPSLLGTSFFMCLSRLSLLVPHRRHASTRSRLPQLRYGAS